MSRVRTLRAALLALVLGASAASAEPAPDSLDVLQSHWHAEASRDLLLEGDRAGAVLAALRGIPSEPTTEDVDLFAAAFDALYIAVSSHAFQADIAVSSIAAWSPSGHRAVTDNAVEFGDVLTGEGLRLWEPSSGRLIGELIAPAPLTSRVLDWETIGASPFSPDGRLVAFGNTDFSAPQSMQGYVRVFETETGTQVAELPGDVMAGFSVTGDLLHVAGFYGDRHILYDTATWQPVLDVGNEVIPLGSYTSTLPGADNAFYLVNSEQPNVLSMEAQTRLYRIDRSGVTVVADLTDMPGFDVAGVWAFPVANPHGPQMAFSLGSGETVILGLDGQRLARIDNPAAHYAGLAFVREGTALAIADKSWSTLPEPDDVQVYALDGTPLEPNISDAAPFLDFVTTPTGSLVAAPTSARLFASPDPWPTGLALYERIWPQIPDQLRAIIEAERVVRPSE